MKPPAIIFWIIFVTSVVFVPSITVIFDEIFSVLFKSIQLYWDKVLDFSGRTPKDETQLFVTVGVAGTAFFWLLCAPFTICDLTGWPNWMIKYRTNEGKVIPVDKWQYTKAFLGTFFNQLVMGPLILPVAIHLMHLYAPFGYAEFTSPIPKPSTVLGQVAFCFLCEDIFLWACHITFHKIPVLWNMHKWHHVWLHPTAIVGIYCHPLEQLCVNMPAFFSGLILSGCHPFSYAVFLFCGMHNVVVNHCGYHLPFTLSGEHHDYHHLIYNSNYGAYGLADWLAGTDAKFLQAVQSKRDIFSTSLTPLLELYPETDNTAAAPAAKKSL